MVWVWAGWEPGYFYRRLGGFHEQQEGAAQWEEAWWRLLESPETARKLREAGVTHVTTRFYKGFGPRAEAAEQARVAGMISTAHEEGLRVFTYIQYGSIMLEAMAPDIPQSPSWKRLDWQGAHDGHPYEYGECYWRNKPCFHQPGWIESLCAMIDAAQAAGSDGIWLDNLQADGCHCEACQRAFRAFLDREGEDPGLAFGLPSREAIRIPRGDGARDPLVQAYTRFRCGETAGALRRLVEHARRDRPDYPFIVNIGLGSPQFNEKENGNWPPDLRIAGVTYAENGAFPGWCADTGRLQTQHFAFKLAEASGYGAIPGAIPRRAPSFYPTSSFPTPRQWRRSLAESLFFGNHAMGGPYGLRAESGGRLPRLLADAGARGDWRCALEEVAPLREELEGSREASAMAILYSYEANAYDVPEHRQARQALEALLLTHQIPFGYVTDEGPWPDDLRVLLLPHILPVSDRLAERILAFMAGGGRIVMTGRTGFYDARCRARQTPVFASLFPSVASPWEENARAWVLDPAGESLWIPGEWGLARAGVVGSDLEPGRFAGLLKKISAQALGLEVMAPVPHLVATVRRLGDGSLLLALINYGEEPVSSIVIDLRFPLETTPRASQPVISAGNSRLVFSDLEIWGTLHVVPATPAPEEAEAPLLSL